MRMLIAEDDADSRAYLTRLLESQGHDVTSAHNGRDALEMARRSPPDLILSDILMPKMDGFELCQRVRADAALGRIPVIIYTATYTEEQDRELALTLGATRFVVKPEEPQRLLSVIAEVIEERARAEAVEPAATDVSERQVEILHLQALARKLDDKVTQLEEERRALAASEEKYRRLIEVLREDYFFYTHDTRGHLTYVSPSITTVLGYSPNEFQSDYRERITESPINADVQRRTEQSIAGNAQPPYEVEIYHKDGSVRLLEVSEIPVFDDQGAVIDVEGIAHDITQSRKDETERHLLATAIDQAAESLIITDRNGIIEYVNPAATRASGYTRAEMVGQNPRMLKSGQHDIAFYDGLSSTIASGSAWRGRLATQRKDGTLYVEDAFITPVRNDADEVVHFACAKRDVTDQVKLEKELRQAQKMEAIGQLAGGVAHDFNNLLTVIISHSEMAQVDLPPDCPLTADLVAILDAGERAAVLTRQLLAFSKRQVLEPRVLDLNMVVENMTNMLRRVIGEDIQLRTALDPDLGRIEVDTGQMEQVLMNLTVNARDAMPRGGRLTLETTNVVLEPDQTGHRPEVEPGPYVMLAVTDTGQGMDAETRSRIFEPFFTTKEAGKGTGLGLATVFGIVNQSSGHIEFSSEVDEGTTFKIYLPRVARPIQAEAIKPAVGDTAGSETILFVEDDDAIRKMVKRILEQNGYTVLVAASGEEALEIGDAQGSAIDLLVTDVILPGARGTEVADSMLRARPDLRVLFMSGYAKGALANRDLSSSKMQFLPKPLASSTLLHKIREMLDTNPLGLR